MTDETIQIPPFPLPAKPREGSPCNGCGYCCAMEICTLGKIFLKLETDEFVPGPCPYMAYQDGKVRCAVVLAEKELGKEPLIAKALAIGWGCDSTDVRERI